jgi:UDPglucose 6-dehydrogenase
MNGSLQKVSVIGLGRLGYPLATCYAAKGFEVIGVDLNPKTVETINQGMSPVEEPGVQDLLENKTYSFEAIQDAKAAVLRSDVSVIIVPTPSGVEGTFSTEFVLDACDSIGAGIAEKGSYHLVVLASTVMPGSTEGEIRRRLESVSTRTCGVNFGLCYAPSFVALGSVVRDFLNPDYVLIGESDVKSGDLLEDLYKNVCQNDPPVVRMNFVNAELTKLATNTFVSTKITFGNMLAQFCEALPGANVDIVTDALGQDSRIGSKYLKGGLGYGGPCLVRDSVALVGLAKQSGSRAWLAEVTDQANRKEVGRLVDLIKKKSKPGDVIGILGLSYKPGTNVVDSSQGLLLAAALANDGISVVAFDPAAMEDARKILGDSIGFAESARCCIRRSNVIVLTTAWREFECLEPGFFGPPGVRKLIDCWRLLEGSEVADSTEYIPLGIGPTA